MKKKYFSWLLLILSVILIFGLTVQSPKGTASLTNSARQVVILSAKNAGITREETVTKWWADTDFLRKIAHIPEYFVLGVTSCYAFSCSKVKKYIIKAVVFCAAISFLDQLLKGVIPYREFDLTDLPVDLLGYGIGIGVLLFGLSLRKYVALLRNSNEMEETK